MNEEKKNTWTPWHYIALIGIICATFVAALVVDHSDTVKVLAALLPTCAVLFVFYGIYRLLVG